MPTPTKIIQQQRKVGGYESIPTQKLVQNIIVGRVVAINVNTKRVTIFSDSVGGNTVGVRYPNGMTPAIGNVCIAISPNPKEKSSFFIVGFYS